MIILSDRDFRKEIKSSGCTIDDTKAPHRLVIRYKGTFVSDYSVTHGKRSKRGDVLAPYIKNFRNQFLIVKASMDAQQ